MVKIINYIQLISTELPQVSAEGKYLLIKLLYDRGWEKLAAHTMRYLAEFSDLGLEATQRAVCELEDNGLIELKSRETLSGKKTFRTLSLILDSGLLSYLDEEPATQGRKRRKQTTQIPPPAHQHQALIGKILDTTFPWRSGNASTTQTGKIQITTKQHSKEIPVRQRLTLCVLLAYANKEGVVRNLSKGDLVRLTGVSIEQMTYQINRLIENGYIRAVVPGISGPGFLKRAKGAYFINLDHPDFGIPQHGRVSIMTALPDADWRLSSQALVDTLQYATESISTTRLDSEFVMHSLHRKEDELNWLGKLADTNTLMAMYAVVPWKHIQKVKPLKQYIQLKIDQYASLFLNEHFNDIGTVTKLQRASAYNTKDEFSIRSKLADIIMEDLFEYELRRYYRESRPENETKQFRLISHLFLHASMQLANIVKSAFIKATMSENSNAIFLILPNNSNQANDNESTLQIECFGCTTSTKRFISIEIESEDQEISKAKYLDMVQMNIFS